MIDETRPAAEAEEPPLNDEEPEFLGTLFVVMVILILTVGMWAAVYLMLLNR